MEESEIKITKPNRIRREYTQTLSATPQTVFPLLCPVEEDKWIPEWSPEFVLSCSGVAEEDCIFQTPGKPNSSIWIISRYEPEQFHIEMYKVTPEHTVGKLRIQVSGKNKKETKATISYEYTSLGEDGDLFLEGFTEESYAEFMKIWEDALNHYLITGEKTA